MKTIKICFLLSLISIIMLNAQTIYVKGNVSTPTEVVKNAMITFTNEGDTTKSYKTTTDSLGNYSIGLITNIEENTSLVPTKFELAQNYPNPFTSSTAISYKLNKQTDVKVKIYDILGREVKRYNIGEQSAGVHGILWDGKNNNGEKVTTGIYFYQLQAGKDIQVNKMVFTPRNGISYNLSLNSNFVALKSIEKEISISGSYKVQITNNENTVPQILNKRFFEVIIKNDTLINFIVERASNDYDICYLKIANNNWEIFLNNIKSTNPKNITNWTTEDSDPAWSLDGKHILFTRDDATGTDLYLYNVEKDEVKDLVPDSTYNISKPLWLPNSSKIVYTYHKIGEKYFTYIIDSSGTNNCQLLNYSADLFFYNDSYHFIYKPVGVGDSTDYCIYKADIYNTIFVDFIINLKSIGKNYVNIKDFDPVKNEILILADPTERILDLLVTYNISTKIVDTISVADSGWVYASPKYSNDYSKIALREINYDDNIHRLSVIESGKKAVLFELSETSKAIDFHPLAFSTDDKYLAFSINVYEEGEYVWWDSYLHIIDLETKEVTYIDMGKNPKWNPLKTY